MLNAYSTKNDVNKMIELIETSKKQSVQLDVWAYTTLIKALKNAGMFSVINSYYLLAIICYYYHVLYFYFILFYLLLIIVYYSCDILILCIPFLPCFFPSLSFTR